MPAEGSSMCEFKGRARYFDVRVVWRRGPARGVELPDTGAGYEQLRDRVAIYPSAMDSCEVGGEVVQAQEGDLLRRLDHLGGRRSVQGRGGHVRLVTGTRARASRAPCGAAGRRGRVSVCDHGPAGRRGCGPDPCLPAGVGAAAGARLGRAGARLALGDRSRAPEPEERRSPRDSGRRGRRAPRRPSAVRVRRPERRRERPSGDEHEDLPVEHHEAEQAHDAADPRPHAHRSPTSGDADRAPSAQHPDDGEDGPSTRCFAVPSAGRNRPR